MVYFLSAQTHLTPTYRFVSLRNYKEPKMQDKWHGRLKKLDLVCKKILFHYLYTQIEQKKIKKCNYTTASIHIQ